VIIKTGLLAPGAEDSFVIELAQTKATFITGMLKE